MDDNLYGTVRIKDDPVQSVLDRYNYENVITSYR